MTEWNSSTFDRVLVRDGNEYAEVLIRKRGETGIRLVLLTSYGDWSYYWSHASENSFGFLSDLDRDYVGGKVFGADYQIKSVKATVEFIREQTLEYRRGMHITRERAAEEWERAQQLEDGDIDISEWVNTSPDSDAYEMIMHEPNPTWVHFWVRLWEPHIRPALKEKAGQTTAA